MYSLAVILFTVLLVQSITANKNTNYSSPYYVSTRPATSIYTFTVTCLGDCIGGECVVSRDGTLESCKYIEDGSPTLYYTARDRQPEYSICRSACIAADDVATHTWCFVNEKGDWDYCSNVLRDSDKQHGETLSTVVNSDPPFAMLPKPCRSKCVYVEARKKNLCRIGRESVDQCTPYAEPAPPRLSEADLDTASDAFGQCVRTKKLMVPLCRRKRADDSDSDDDLNEEEESACLARDYPEYVDIYRRQDRRRLANYLPAGTVANDALAFRQRGTMMVDPPPPAPLTSVTTIHIAHLDLNLPTTIRARIDAAALDQVVQPRPSDAIERAVPSLTAALRRIRYSHDGIDYDVGHMIGYQSGGADADFNFAPQAGTLNRGVWLNMENQIRNWVNSVRPYGFVDMLVVIYYHPVHTWIPVAFGVNLAFYYTENRVASVCNDMAYFNFGNPHRHRGRGKRQLASNDTIN